ncbi:CBL-interacting serine/threonine-protein kinase 5-like [Glycine max]|uniref:CBL-interacting serine/threonine-protein kinase 5-like n=1 Tax=Glycine max TaxID=3847 RepID=UPI00023C9AB2|nr:CBL-interacting serine/threonine-protein kinase 5-like [Glycine max]|eukprot:XP_006588149.1 CBL-interacting serine/threonine-protein kinase 5-like [Glycine max]
MAAEEVPVVKGALPFGVSFRPIVFIAKVTSGATLNTSGQHENLMTMYNKVLRVEFEFPPWFLPESKKLISKIVVADPAKRTTISAITRMPWFWKGFSSFFAPNLCQLEKQEALTITEEENNFKMPKFFNAFEFISSMSSRFNLSRMFESKRKTTTMFTLKCSTAVIVAKIAVATWWLRFRVAKVKDFKIRLKGVAKGRKKRQAVTVEVFEVAPEVTFATKTMEGEGSYYNRYPKQISII